MYCVCVCVCVSVCVCVVGGWGGEGGRKGRKAEDAGLCVTWCIVRIYYVRAFPALLLYC